ncbi:hypothetical protein AMTRI_Chr04g182760 [Amborella trichopoda]
MQKGSQVMLGCSEIAFSHYYTTILYGCAVWGAELVNKYWKKKIENVQKQFLLEGFKVKQQSQYNIMLVVAELLPLEVEAIFQFVAFAQQLTTFAIDKMSKEVLLAT